MCTENKREFNLCTGYYLNVFDERSDNRTDIFLILNEVSGEPSIEEVARLESIIHHEIENYSGDDKEEVWFLLNTAIGNSGCKCVDYGFQIIVESYPKKPKFTIADMRKGRITFD